MQIYFTLRGERLSVLAAGGKRRCGGGLCRIIGDVAEGGRGRNANADTKQYVLLLLMREALVTLAAGVRVVLSVDQSGVGGLRLRQGSAIHHRHLHDERGQKECETHGLLNKSHCRRGVTM